VSVESTLAAGRRAAEQLMTSRCRIIRLHEVALDTASLTLTDLDPSDDGVYEGPCRVKTTSLAVTTADAEGQLVAVQSSTLSLPVSVGGVRVGDRVEIVDGGPDPDLTGRRFRIAGLHAQTQATAHRYPIETA
jgi:hypothetical protein